MEYLRFPHKMEWIQINWDTSRVKYFAPIEWMPQIYEVAREGL
jgi:hypothetical protein